MQPVFVRSVLFCSVIALAPLMGSGATADSEGPVVLGNSGKWVVDVSPAAQKSEVLRPGFGGAPSGLTGKLGGEIFLLA